MSLSASQLAAQLYDTLVSDWEGEIDFYQRLAAETQSRGERVLEIACGTGRVALRLARAGVSVVGLDLQEEMLVVARGKSAGVANIRWEQGDMRAFDLGEIFGLAIIPGHSFQNLVTPADQVSALETIKKHLAPGGRLVVHLDHQDVDWLGEITTFKRGVFGQNGETRHPETGNRLRIAQAWSYARASQTASLVMHYEELDDGGRVLNSWERGPIPLHCVFPFEMEHLLARTGYTVEAVYGDFMGGELAEDSAEMVWVARKQ